MPIQRLLKEAVFDPAEVAALTAAYDAALEMLRPKDRTDPLKELIAKKIIEVARHGERDPVTICARTLVELGLPTTS
jgi:hypothetical protein